MGLGACEWPKLSFCFYGARPSKTSLSACLDCAAISFVLSISEGLHEAMVLSLAFLQFFTGAMGEALFINCVSVEL